MRFLLTILLTLALASTALAFDLGAARPVKAPANLTTPPPAGERQGGDTFADAVPITVPYSGTGSTVGYNDDYDPMCPFDGNIAPDVVYSLMPPEDIVVVVDLYGSTYDTKVAIYDIDFVIVACNDDYYPDYVSKIEQAQLYGGEQYFLVVDGYGSSAGDYVLNVTEYVPCVVDCVPWAEDENEPPLVDGYVDNFNGGCNTDGSQPFSVYDSEALCGTSGWYLAADGGQRRDTDWFEITIPDLGWVEIIGDAEYECSMFHLGPQDCDNVAVIQSATIGPCLDGTIHIDGTPGETIWFWVGPTTFDGEGEFTYLLQRWPTPTAIEPASWSSVKGLFD